MTENKRFTLKPYDGIRCDVFDGEIEIAEVHRDDAKGLVNLLNNLSDENKHLKEALIELKEIGDYQYMRIKELSDENERLEQQISYLIRELKTEMETAISKNERIRLDFAITVLESLKVILND